MHKSIILNNISLYFPNKICFENFSAQIQPGRRIAVIGNNGSGKSSLLKIISGGLQPSEGSILNNDNIVFGYVPQLVYEYENSSGGEKFNKALSAALALRPDALLLDEPTNHLDLKNRKSLIKMLEHYKGTLIIVSHDAELLRSSINTFWHIDNGIITVFSGKFDDYKNELFQKRQSLEDELTGLKKEKKENHKALMKEQERAAKSKNRGEKFVEQKKWLPAVGDLKQSSAEKSSGKNKGNINERRGNVNEQLSALRIPEILKPKFSLTAKDIGSKTILSLSGASAGYADKTILRDITLSVSGGEHIAITGDNGSGKSTLLKAILNYPEIIKDGFWDTPAADDIAYLDQYYDTLDNNKTVIEMLAEAAPQKTHAELRDILNGFLFRKNEEVNKKVAVLSGGEKARLSLAKIAVKTPKLLLIDEITNNIDLETKEHVTQVLKEYPGAMVIVSHDIAFLEDLGIDHFYELK
ncbi:MAG: ATP-binding cassette domain-containing protein [Endomicrobia bacterium]|nr:ATP-binding cassette domain-containing protein [Endomicrobiia bacterium]MCL2507192.1 ATP-binding cassette domain-containing protein [Endomicrobiia bacterium]